MRWTDLSAVGLVEIGASLLEWSPVCLTHVVENWDDAPIATVDRRASHWVLS
jgi:hypothetical protein